MGGRGGSSGGSGISATGQSNSSLASRAQNARSTMERSSTRLEQIDRQLEGLRGDEQNGLLQERRRVARQWERADRELMEVQRQQQNSQN